jgi:hypothetical protein
VETSFEGVLGGIVGALIGFAIHKRRAVKR